MRASEACLALLHHLTTKSATHRLPDITEAPLKAVMSPDHMPVPISGSPPLLTSCLSLGKNNLWEQNKLCFAQLTPGFYSMLTPESVLGMLYVVLEI